MNFGTAVGAWSGRIQQRVIPFHIRAALLRPRFQFVAGDRAGVRPLSDCELNGENCKADDTREITARRAAPVETHPRATSRRDLRLLPPATEKVWNFLKEQAGAGRFCAGGRICPGAASPPTVLSEDLDFRVSPGQASTPAARSSPPGGGRRRVQFFAAADDEAAVQEFSRQRNWNCRITSRIFLVNDTVKVSFFAPDEPLRKILPAGTEAKGTRCHLARIVQGKESGVRKALQDARLARPLFADEGSRLYHLRLFAPRLMRAGCSSQCDTGLTPIVAVACRKRDDEGYAHLLSNAPSLAEMKAFFEAQRAKLGN